MFGTTFLGWGSLSLMLACGFMFNSACVMTSCVRVRKILGIEQTLWRTRGGNLLPTECLHVTLQLLLNELGG